MCVIYAKTQRSLVANLLFKINALCTIQNWLCFTYHHKSLSHHAAQASHFQNSRRERYRQNLLELCTSGRKTLPLSLSEETDFKMSRIAFRYLGVVFFWRLSVGSGAVYGCNHTRWTCQLFVSIWLDHWVPRYLVRRYSCVCVHRCFWLDQHLN